MALPQRAVPPGPAPALPCSAGVCLKSTHYLQALEDAAAPGFLEIHAENYLHAGGPAHRHLEAIRGRHRLSIHGVGLSLGGPAPPSQDDLAARRALLDRYQPDQFSEHLAWTALDGNHFNDLLPLSYSGASLARVAAHVHATQDALGRRILIENPATYVRFRSSTLTEGQFLSELVQRTGCGLLLDVNNIVVSAANHGEDPRALLHAMPLHAVGEVHLAGHRATRDRSGLPLLLDTHDGPVQAPTWALFRELLALTGALPTLIEWDSALPTWSGLLHEAALAQTLLDANREVLRAAV